MNADDTIALLVLGMERAARIIPLGCCGNYAKAVCDLDQVEPMVQITRMYHVEAFI